MMSPCKNHRGIRGSIFVGQARLTFSKGTQGPNVSVFLLSRIFRIWMDGNFVHP